MTGQNTAAVLTDEQRNSLRDDLSEVWQCLYGNQAVLRMLSRLAIEREIANEDDEPPGLDLPDNYVIGGLHTAAHQLAAMAESRLKPICEQVGIDVDDLIKADK